METTSPDVRTRAGRLLIVVLVGALVAWFFADVVFRDRVFAYRDTAYLYQPLYRFVEAQWSAGRIPLWNPHENCGTPLAANPIAAAFYPGKLLFRLPIGYETAFRAYVVLHVLLAAAMSFVLARHWRCSLPAAGLAAISYAFGGCVLFQHCNVIYLVSAAWLPAAMAAADRAISHDCRRGLFACSAALALMILSGDPQTAYHALLLIGLYVVLQWRAGVRAVEAEVVRQSLPKLTLRWLAIALGMLLLAAVQILPTAELSRRSERAAFESPRSLWELASFVVPRDGGSEERADWSAGLRAVPAGNSSHDAGTYQFSLSPWRMAELAWPNFSGRSFPIHRRWMTALPAEGRIWVPTLYLGAIPLVLAVSAFRLRSAALPVRWMSWCVIVGLVASLGAYGPGWLAAEASCMSYGEQEGAFPVGGGFGGLYWLFNVVLPGYAQFRFPAKWLVVVALGLSQLAAFGCDAVLRGESRRAKRLFALLASASLVGLLLAIVVRPWWSQWLQQAPADSLFGPLEVEGAWRDLAGSFLQSAIVAAIAWLLLRRASINVRRVAWVLLLVTGVDVAVANRWLVLTAPGDLQSVSSSIATKMKPVASGFEDAELDRAYRAPYWQPKRFAETADVQRGEQSVAWDRDTLWPRYHLDAEIGLVAVVDTLSSLDDASLVPHLHREARAVDDSGAAASPTPALDLTGTGWIIRPEESTRDATLIQRQARGERVWVAEEVVELPGIDERNMAAVRQRTDEVLARLAQALPDMHLAVVERQTRREAASSDHEAARTDAPLGEGAVLRDDVNELEIEVRLNRESLVVLADAFDPAWVATHAATGEALEIVRVNRVLRGVWLPAGQHRVIFRYQPTWLYAGGIVSAMTLLVSGTLLVASVRRRAGSCRATDA
ncbi:MAG: hypothetical protein KF708_23740 [Pirellulales bacterium]|nr:hypothetical protein [Pirellulales bacterium]